MAKRGLLESLRSKGFSEKIISSFEKVRREDFIPGKHKKYSYEDIALPTSEGQTISQPYTIAFMLNLLDVRDSQKILEVGSGSGYVLALLSELNKSGKIFGIERIKKLVNFSSLRLRNYKNVKVILGDGSKGLNKEAPFDRVLVSASAQEVPLPLIEQLKEEGTLVIPVGNSILKIKKNKEITTEKYYGFSFVPLIE